MLPFENIPDDTVPVTAYLKELLKLATQDRPLLIFLDSVDELTGSQENISKLNFENISISRILQDANKMSWLPLKIPPHCKEIFPDKIFFVKSFFNGPRLVLVL